MMIKEKCSFVMAGPLVFIVRNHKHCHCEASFVAEAISMGINGE
ncbi:MAG: hypothetical protein ABIK84_06455 [candidate division WOR-3 bacterium]